MKIKKGTNMTIYHFMQDSGVTSDLLPDMRSDAEQYNSKLSLDNNEAPEITTAIKAAQEIINTSGAEVIVYLRTDNQDYDKIWDEDPDPTYWNPIRLKASYKLEQLEVELKKWGIDASNKLKITFAYEEIFRTCKRLLRTGDVIGVLYDSNGGMSKLLKPRHYRIVNVTPSGNYRYVWLYLSCDTEILNSDIAARPIDDIHITPVEDHYREYIG